MKSILLILIVAAAASAQVARNAIGQVSSIPQQPVPTSFDCSADGSVTNSVTGEPIARAHVILNAGGTAYSSSTDASGHWVISDMGCVSVMLQVTRVGFLQDATPRTRRGPQRLVLNSGSPVHDVKTELTPQSVAFGKVLDDQGDPIMGAQVMALSARVTAGKLRLQQTGASMTNDLGEYRIANLQHGKYAVCVHINQPNVQSAQPISADSCYPGPIDGGAASTMDLPAGREAKVDFTLAEVVPVHVRGTVTGLPEGRGTGINLVKRGPNTDFTMNVPGTVREGKFDFRVPPGPYTLTADYFEGGKRLSARVPVDAGASDIDNIVVNLDAGFTVTGNVRVVSQSGQASSVPQFGVNLIPSESGSEAGLVKWEPDHSAFTVNDLLAGTYRLNVFPPPPYYVNSATLGGQDILNSEVPISQAAGPIEVVLRDDGGSIEGDVADANGQPVASGVMLIRNSTRVAVAASQANGHFRLQNLAPGDYTIYAWDNTDDVEYADADWMRRNAAGGMAVTVTAGQNQQVKLTEQLVPQL
ncbi:MAG TPA: carboxypeptidase-like regulatory domain-containing protein [Bryobacteraceae bacterium]|jgi:hypothetical protein